MTLKADRGKLAKVLNRFAEVPIMVIGDLILDRFLWGRVERISPEAPVPVVEILRETVHLGGAANVVANLVALGARPIPVGVVGNDAAGETLLGELERLGVDASGVVVDPVRSTTVKARIIAQHQQVCRTDWESRAAVSTTSVERLRENCEAAGKVSGVILSDYGKGVLTRDLIARTTEASRQSGVFVAADPKGHDFSVYRGVTMVTPNKKEAEQASRIEIRDDASLARAAQSLLQSTNAEYVLITRGEEGMSLFDEEGHSYIPTAAREVYDVTGAGDTVVATLTLAAAAGATIADAALLANQAAGVAVGKLGTASVTVQEILASF